MASELLGLLAFQYREKFGGLLDERLVFQLSVWLGFPSTEPWVFRYSEELVEWLSLQWLANSASQLSELSAFQYLEKFGGLLVGQLVFQSLGKLGSQLSELLAFQYLEKFGGLLVEQVVFQLSGKLGS